MTATKEHLEKAATSLRLSSVGTEFDPRARETLVADLGIMLARSSTILDQAPSGLRHATELRLPGDRVIAVLGERTPEGVKTEIIADETKAARKGIDNFMWHRDE